jgi:FixJ family two-component response regulator
MVHVSRGKGHVESLPRIVAVVEDDPSMRKSIERLLNAHGFPTAVYSSGESFLSRDARIKIGCVVLDIHLDGMSGIELRRWLKQSGSTVSVVFVTAVDDDALELEAFQAGCVAYLHKPFSAASLVGAVNKALSDSPID